MSQPESHPQGEPQSFAAAYAVLERNAKALRETDAPDIDKLVETVTESVDAFAVVRTRLDGIDAALKEVFSGLDQSV